MELIHDRAFLNPQTVWGIKQSDAARTLHIKSVNPHFSRNVYHDHKVFPSAPTSRFLSEHVGTYLT